MKIGLTDDQRSIVEHEDGALLVLAGPGSGKTRVLTERVRRLLSRPGQNFRVLALTFTNKAANEMMERLEDVREIRQRAFVGTLHSFCMEVLSNRGKTVGVTGLPHIYESIEDRKEVLLAAVRKDYELFSILKQEPDRKKQNAIISKWIKGIGDAKNKLLIPEMVADTVLQNVYRAYDNELRIAKAVDYDDLLLLTHRLFEERPKIADLYRRQYRYICVDEGQDLNEAQYQLLKALCGSDYKNVMIVGDPNQAIYVFNGAHPKYLLLFERDFNATKIKLYDNFRCSQSVVRAAQGLDPEYQISGRLPIEGEVVIKACQDEENEAEFVVSTIEKLLKEGHRDIETSVELDQIAVLARTRFHFSKIEEKLEETGLQFYKKVSIDAFESMTNLVEQFELSLRILSNPADRLHLSLLAKKWNIDLSADELLREPVSPNEADEFLARLARMSGKDSAEIVMKAIGATNWTRNSFEFPKGLQVLRDQANVIDDEDERASILYDIAEWKKHWEYFVRGGTGTAHSVQSFFASVALGSTQAPRQPGIALMTIHAAKGMEFDIVFVVGVNEGSLPHYKAEGDALAEERRNAFVAVTRSQRLLYLTYPQEKVMPWGDTKRQSPSRFLGEISASLDRGE